LSDPSRASGDGLPSNPRDALLTVGVTGTNGKTTTTRWIAAALATAGRPVAQATTLGSFLDDEPLTFPKTWEGFVDTMRLCVSRGGRFASIELTSEALARGFAKDWPCQVGVFTNLTHDHLDAHGSPEHYLASKAQLFVHLPEGGTAVLNGCDPASALLEEILPAGIRVLRYGAQGRGIAKAPLDLRATSVVLGWSGTRVTLEASPALAGAPRGLTLRAIGDVYAENALAALCAAVAAGAEPLAAASAIGEAAAPTGRFQVIRERPYVVVDYAHTPDALARTLRAARALTRGKLVVVFGAGGNRDAKKRRPMGKAASIADRVFLTSDNPRDEDPARIARAIREGIAARVKVVVELDRAQAISRAVREAGEEDVVVVAGQGHETEQLVGGEVRHFDDAEVVRGA
jgi:UDP-N-acetylmuramoyl-L-alanyl-D-glutamate--2,6-diaminopimelate ligase